MTSLIYKSIQNSSSKLKYKKATRNTHRASIGSGMKEGTSIESLQVNFYVNRKDWVISEQIYPETKPVHIYLPVDQF